VTNGEDAELLRATLAHLEWLVRSPTENPPKRINESGILERLATELRGFDVRLTDEGAGSVNLFARRGNPRLLFNFHLDTVPAASGWNGSPFELRVADGKAFGLGACDIKGAAAAMLAAVQSTTADVALLFSTDEEAGPGRCVTAFLKEGMTFDGVIVAEPTRGKAVLAHRGIGTASGVFSGIAGHASRASALTESAIHEAIRWANATLLHAERVAGEDHRTGLPGIRFNLGRIEGGNKPNVVAAEARVRFGVRPPPGRPVDEVIRELESLAPNAHRVAWETGFLGPTLPALSRDTSRAEALAAKLAIPKGEPVDFWTEAALFSAAGHDAIVFGPGDIAQAHACDEWVDLTELAHAASIYRRILTPQN
jgi:acetylornithine deacetylase